MTPLAHRLIESVQIASIPDRMWTRKPNALKDVTQSIERQHVPPDIRTLEVDSLNEPLGNDFPRDPFYIVTSEGWDFLVRSEGYSYPRYVVGIAPDAASS